ncbi:MAG: gamma-glutamyl-gamma-aminobutyrate hydrolase family protein [Cystobacterineae bacterium]|nr:gamma-glutamyl-gamma-aminobutyrate hydrolase family protein [Cystobacterineae bacterium]
MTTGKKPMLMVSAGLYSSELSAEEEVLSACSRAVWKAGGVPLLLPPVNDERLLVATLERANGWLLSGAGGAYKGGGGPQEDERLLHFGLQHAMKRGIPILACGRACEFLASFWGLSVDGQRPEAVFEHQQPLSKSQPFHPVIFQKESWLAACLGSGQLMVNSMHRPEYWLANEHAGIAAKALDGTTEAIEGRKGKVIGLRWNPEFLLESVPCQVLLFRNFISLARQYR